MAEQQGPEVRLPDPIEMSQKMASIAERSQKLVTDFLERQTKEPGSAIDPLNIMNPGKIVPSAK